jgi:hypothetical protein
MLSAQRISCSTAFIESLLEPSIMFAFSYDFLGSDVLHRVRVFVDLPLNEIWGFPFAQRRRGFRHIVDLANLPLI